MATSRSYRWFPRSPLGWVGILLALLALAYLAAIPWVRDLNVGLGRHELATLGAVAALLASGASFAALASDRSTVLLGSFVAVALAALFWLLFAFGELLEGG